MINPPLSTLAHALVRVGPPTWAQHAVVQVLCNIFARAFDVEAPRITRYVQQCKMKAIPQEGQVRFDLYAFREFSASCMEEALRNPAYAAQCQVRLFEQAKNLGQQLRLIFRPRQSDAVDLVRDFYSVIGIEIDGSNAGTLLFKRCYFSVRYSAEVCAFMQAFDSGFIAGFCKAGGLDFQARITQGSPCCIALIVQEKE